MSDVKAILHALERELDEKNEYTHDVIERIANADNEYDVILYLDDALDLFDLDDIYILKLLVKLAAAKLDELESE